MGKLDQEVWLRMEEIEDEVGKGGRMVERRVVFYVLELEVEVTMSSEYILWTVLCCSARIERLAPNRVIHCS